MACFIKLLILAGMVILYFYNEKQEENIKAKAYCRQYQDIVDRKGYRNIDEYIAEERRKFYGR